MDDSNAELEKFRRQWKDEVSARSRQSKEIPTSSLGDAIDRSTEPQRSKPPRPTKIPPTHHPAADTQHDGQSDDDEINTGLSEDLERSKIGEEHEWLQRTAAREPKSAIEHYEKGVEKEVQGKLGDSLSHYRKAYRLDAKVDQTYKNKHFPASSNVSNPNPSSASATVPSTAHHSPKEPARSNLPLLDIVASYSQFPIPAAEPVIAGDKPPPCPIAIIPPEVLQQILLSCAVLDPACFARLALVCRRLSFHVYHDKAIWKRIALGPEFGLDSQLYEFGCDLQGRDLVYSSLDDSDKPSSSADITDLITDGGQDWKELFHSRPRVRYSGVYISTVNYTRPGGASATQATWNTPVHIVTYYRYLRFFRDGSVISLLTTHEPLDVVHHLTWENLKAARRDGRDPSVAAPVNSSAQAGQPIPHGGQIFMKHALLGRWRLCHPLSSQERSVNDIATGGAGIEGDLHIETEGVGPRYMYTMHLSLKSSSRSKHAVKNNKLIWKGFWYYNQLTADWAEFGLKNDKPYFFSRVKSYGLGY
ncbi:MAG: hypothetical protein Q9160_006462 [Pyrenula sp. 1 TL-2023]